MGFSASKYINWNHIYFLEYSKHTYVNCASLKFDQRMNWTDRLMPDQAIPYIVCRYVCRRHKIDFRTFMLYVIKFRVIDGVYIVNISRCIVKILGRTILIFKGET